MREGFEEFARETRAVQHAGVASGGGAKLIPNFLLVFIAIVTLNSFGLVPSAVQSVMSDASRWCIVISIAALGIKTSLAALAKVGHQAILFMVAETAFIACLVMTLVRLG